MSLKTTIALIVDRLLDLLPGERNDATSLEARTRKALDKSTAAIVAATQHADALIEVAQTKAEAIVTAAERTALHLANELKRLDDAGLIEPNSRFAQVLTGLAAAGFHPEVVVEAVQVDATSAAGSATSAAGSASSAAGSASSATTGASSASTR